MEKRIFVLIATCAVIGCAVWFLVSKDLVPSVRTESAPSVPSVSGTGPTGAVEDVSSPISDAPRRKVASPVADASSEDDSDPEVVHHENETEKRVNAFDDLTDKWMEKAEVSLDDIDAFVKAFKEVPDARKNECVHRALNLIPDANVMLLVGILMDKSFSKELAETVFGDILNRPESVKKPIMREIYKDKTHPCWADVAWILDATGELKPSNEVSR